MNEEQYRKVLELLERQSELIEEIANEVEKSDNPYNMGQTLESKARSLTNAVRLELRFLNTDQD